MKTEMTTSTLPAIVPMIMNTIGGANASGSEQYQAIAASSAHTNAPESHGGVWEEAVTFETRPKPLGIVIDEDAAAESAAAASGERSDAGGSSGPRMRCRRGNAGCIDGPDETDIASGAMVMAADAEVSSNSWKEFSSSIRRDAVSQSVRRGGQ